MPTLISSANHIDASWLQAIFRKAGKDLPAITNVHVEALGNGNTGDTVRAVFEYETAAPTGAPTSVVCKFHPAVSEKFETTKLHGVFVIEANALKLLAGGVDASIPELYFVDVAEDGGEFNLVCEDLSTFCELGDQITGCSIKEAEAAVIELAKLHRQFWNEPQLDHLSWVRPRMAFPENAMELLHDRLTDLLNEEQYDTVKKSIPLIFDWLKLKPANQTLIHSDCRVDNILFDNRSSGAPKAYLIDFALANIGDATADVAYFLTSSVSPEDRLVCEMDLLKIHTQEIAKKDPTYTIEMAVEAYRENIVSSLYLTMIASMGMPDTEHNRLLLTRLFERNCAAVKHWAL